MPRHRGRRPRHPLVNQSLTGGVSRTSYRRDCAWLAHCAGRRYAAGVHRREARSPTCGPQYRGCTKVEPRLLAQPLCGEGIRCPLRKGGGRRRQRRATRHIAACVQVSHGRLARTELLGEVLLIKPVLLHPLVEGPPRYPESLARSGDDAFVCLQRFRDGGSLCPFEFISQSARRRRK